MSYRFRPAPWGLLAAAFALLIPAAHAQSQPWVLSPRVGEVIDADERAYFGLFPKADGFHTARLSTTTTDSIAVRVFDEAGERIHLWNLSPSAVAELQTYVEQYEDYEASERLRWQLLLPWARYRNPYIPRPRVRMTLHDGSRLEGELLRTDPSELLMYVPDASYRWQDVPTAVRRVSFAEVDYVDVPHSPRSVGLSVAGVAVPAILFRNKATGLALSPVFLASVAVVVGERIRNDRVKHQRILVSGVPEHFQFARQRLDRTQSFRAQIAPELAMLQSVEAGGPFPAPRFRRLHVAMGVGTRLLRTPFEGRVLGFGEVREVPVYANQGLTWSVDAAVAVHPRLRLGGTFAHQAPPVGLKDEEALGGLLLNGYADVVVKPARLARPAGRSLLGWYAHRAEFALGGGVSWARMTGRFNPQYPAPQQRNLIENIDDVDASKATVQGLGFFGQASMDYYLSPQSSMFVRVTYGVHSDLVVPGRTETRRALFNGTPYEDRTVDIYEFAPYEAQPLEGHVTFGHRWHF